MTPVAPDLLERLRRTLATGGVELTPTRVAEALRGEGLVLGHDAVLEVVDALHRDIVGAGPLDPLLRTDGVTDVLVNGPHEVYIDRGDGLERADVTFPDDEAVRRLAQRLASAAGRRLDDASPYVDVRLPDGTRCHAVLAPIARPGTVISLRIPARRTFTLDELMERGTVSPGGAQLLRVLVDSRAAFLVTGGTGSGKTTLLATLLGLVDPAERLVLVEDSSELSLELFLHTMTRSVIYLRQSLDRDGTGAAVERQRKACERLCVDRDWSIVRVFTENDTSATNGRRPRYSEMLAMVERGEVEIIVAWHIDRLTRKLTELEELIELSARTRVKVATVTGDLDLTTDTGRLLGRILASVARGEVERKSARQIAANEQRAAEGKWPGGPAPFGWNRDGTHHPARARHLRRAYREMLAGGSLRGIAADWNTRGIESSSGRTAWRPTTLRRRLLDPRNAGLRSLNGTIVGDGKWRPIIDTDTFYATEALLTDTSRRLYHGGHARRYLLSGLATCGRCGRRAITGQASRGHRTYRCPTGHLSRKADPLDAIVVRLIVGRMSMPDAAEALRRDDSPKLDALADRATVLRTRLDQLATALADGSLDLAGVRRESGRLRAELADVQLRLTVPDRAAVLGELAGADDAAEVWERLDLDRRRAVIDTLATVEITQPVKGSRRFGLDAIELTWRT
jgi:site-specific DNA recombinase